MPNGRWRPNISTASAATAATAAAATGRLVFVGAACGETVKRVRLVVVVVVVVTAVAAAAVAMQVVTIESSPIGRHLCHPTTCQFAVCDGGEIATCTMSGRVHECGPRLCQAGVARGAAVVCPITGWVVGHIVYSHDKKSIAAFVRPIRASTIRLPSLVPSSAVSDVICQTTLALLCGQARVDVARDEMLKFCGTVVYTFREIVGAMHPLAGMVSALATTVHVLNGCPAGTGTTSTGGGGGGCGGGGGGGASGGGAANSAIPGCFLRGALIPAPVETNGVETFASRANRWVCRYFALAWARFQRCRAAIVGWIQSSQSTLNKADTENIMHKMDLQQFVVQMCTIARRGVASKISGRDLVSCIPWLVVFGPTHGQIVRLCDSSKRHTKMQLRAALNTMDELHHACVLSINPCLSWPVVFDVQDTCCTQQVIETCTRDARITRGTVFMGDLYREPTCMLHHAIAAIRHNTPRPPPSFVALYSLDAGTTISRVRATHMPRSYETGAWKIVAMYGPYASLEAAERAVIAYGSVQENKRDDAIFLSGTSATGIRVWR